MQKEIKKKNEIKITKNAKMILKKGEKCMYCKIFLENFCKIFGSNWIKNEWEINWKINEIK